MRDRECGDPAALSVTLTNALLAPAAAGVKVTVNEQVPVGTIVAAEHVVVFEKSVALVPVIESAEMTRFALPELPIVTVKGALDVLAIWLPNTTGFGAKLIVGVEARG